MGLFDKKYCDICGEKIGLLGNRKLEDGNLCKDCAKKLSSWFSDRRRSTVEDIKGQLAYREENREKAAQFRTTRSARIGRCCWTRITAGSPSPARGIWRRPIPIFWTLTPSPAAEWTSMRAARS